MTAVIDKKFTSLSYFDAVALNDKFAALDALIASGAGTPTLVPCAEGVNQETAIQISAGRSVLTGSGNVALPNATAGASVTLTVGDGAECGLFAKDGSSDTINGDASGARYTVPAGGAAVYVDCFVGGAWVTNGGAA